MRKQTFIAVMVDEKNVLKDFYRFSCKKASTVEKQMREAMSLNNTGLMSIFRHDWMKENIVQCRIYQTKDGYSYGAQDLVAEFTMDWAEKVEINGKVFWLCDKTEVA